MHSSMKTSTSSNSCNSFCDIITCEIHTDGKYIARKNYNAHYLLCATKFLWSIQLSTKELQRLTWHYSRKGVFL